MNANLFTQIGLVIAAIVIGVIFIRPQFTVIAETQDNISDIRDLIADTKELNRVLLEKANIVQSVSAQNQDRLDEYLPTEVDELGVMADVSAMADISNVTISEFTKIESAQVTSREDAFSANNNAQGQTEEDTSLESTEFSLTLLGTYEPVQAFLRLIAVNNYPIVIKNLEVVRSQARSEEIASNSLSVEVTFEVPHFTSVERVMPTNSTSP